MSSAPPLRLLKFPQVPRRVEPLSLAEKVQRIERLSPEGADIIEAIAARLRRERVSGRRSESMLTPSEWQRIHRLLNDDGPEGA